jgi:hypothetical protein
MMAAILIGGRASVKKYFWNLSALTTLYLLLNKLGGVLVRKWHRWRQSKGIRGN